MIAGASRDEFVEQGLRPSSTISMLPENASETVSSSRLAVSATLMFASSMISTSAASALSAFAAALASSAAAAFFALRRASACSAYVVPVFQPLPRSVFHDLQLGFDSNLDGFH